MKFGTSNHRLPIEVGRWNNLQRHERIYNLCNNNHIGGELYYLLECNVLSSIRNDFFARKHYVQPNIIKFCNFLTNTNSLLKKKGYECSKFIEIFLQKQNESAVVIQIVCI